MQSLGLPHYRGEIAIRASTTDRADFLTRTYIHLAGAIAAFILLETAAQQLGVGQAMMGMMTGTMSMLIMFGLFMGASMLATKMAQSNTSPALAYGGLGLYVVAITVFFAPLLYIASTFYPGVIFDAALITIAIFTALTVTVLVTRKDFSFLGGVLKFVAFAALGLIIASIFMGFTLGTWFSIGMILLMAGYILYDTSNMLHRYRTDQHVPAALALFASIAIMFMYVLRLLMSRR